MYTCMYTCTCMSCTYSMSWIHRYMYISIPSPSRNSRHAVIVSCLSWFPWTPPPRPQRSHVRQPRVPPRNVRLSLTLGGKNQFAVLAGKKSWLRSEGSFWPVPPRGTIRILGPTGMGRERKLREHDGSHNHSWNYSRELKERTPLLSTSECQPQKKRKENDSGTVDLSHAFVFSFKCCCPRELTSLKMIPMVLAWCCPCPCLYCYIPTMSHLQGFQGAAPVPTFCTCCFVHCSNHMWSRSLFF